VRPSEERQAPTPPRSTVSLSRAVTPDFPEPAEVDPFPLEELPSWAVDPEPYPGGTLAAAAEVEPP